MANNYNYHNGHCHQCSKPGEPTFVAKGTGMWLWADGFGRVFCRPCGVARQRNRAINARRRAEANKLPKLFG